MPNSTDPIAGIAKEISKLPSVRYLDDVELSDGLLAGSIKSAAVIACSDMGWLVPYVCSSPKANLFLFQDFGHNFATCGFVEGSVGEGIENVVVYGHSVCEFTKFLARSAYNRRSEKVFQSANDKEQLELYSAACQADSEDFWESVGQYNVLFEVKRMLADPIVAPIAKTGRLKVHAWFYKSSNMQLEVFDPAKEAFIVPNTKLDDSVILKFVPSESHDVKNS